MTSVAQIADVEGVPPLNGAEETRQLIIKTAEEMGYAPNQAARQLRRRRSDSIGYILPAGIPRFSDAFFAEFIAALGDEASAHGFDQLISIASPGSQADGRPMSNGYIAGRWMGLSSITCT